jgi:anti-sigma B factor antagonist
MMTTNIEKNGSMIVIGLNGSFDIGEVTDFETRFKSILKQHPEHVALRLKDLNYIDSSGVGSLIRCMNYAMRENSHLLCFDLSESIHSVFEMTHLSHFIEVLSHKDFSQRYCG